MPSSIPTDGDIDVNLPPLVDDEDDDEASPLGDYLADAERSFETLAPPLSSVLSSSIPNSLKRRRSSTRTSAECSTRSSNAVSVSGSSGPSAMSAPLVGASSTSSARAGTAAGNSIGPRALGTPLRLPSPIRTTRSSDHEFAERFKFLVASSGLLEKTQLYSTVASPDGATSTSMLSPTSALDDSAREPASAPADTPAPPSSRGALDVITTEDGSMRWDIIAAIAVLMASLAYVIGPSKVVVTSAAIATGAAFLLPGRPAPSRPATPVGSTADDDEPVLAPKPTSAARVMAALDRLLSESRSLDHAITIVLQLLAPRPDDTERGHDLRIALNRLLDDMTDYLASATSSLIPLADRSELTVLSTFYDIPVIAPRRRRPSTSDDSDGEWGRPAGVTRAKRSQSSSAASPPPEVLRYALLSPKEHARAKSPVRALATPFDPNDKFTKMPERVVRHKRQSWSTDWSGSSPSSSFSRSTDDRIPITEDDEGNVSDILFSAGSSTEGGAAFPDLPNGLLSPPALIRPLALPFTPKRASPLAQALERLESPNLPRAPTPPFPVLSTRPSQSPFRRSLQDIPYIPSPPASTHEAAADLAKARASANMSSAKRRSLQAPFSPPQSDTSARDQAIMAAGASLQRAKSLPQSDLARLRPLKTAVAPITPSTPGQRASLLFETGRRGTPNHSRTGSRVSVDTDVITLPHPGFRFEPPTATSTPNKRSIPLSFDSPRPNGSQRERADMMTLGFGHAASFGRIQQPHIRVPSVSPLTLQGLKASCLGVHLKRRRVACCLLGLKFATPHDGRTQYWDDVCSALHTLSNKMAEGRANLETLIERSSCDLAAAATIAAIVAPGTTVLTPPKNTGPTFISRAGGDFAPRDSAEQALMVSIDDLQRTLAHVWARCDEMRTKTAGGTLSNADATWADIRSDVGSMLRIIERGRDAVAPREEEEVEVLDDSVDDSFTERSGSPTPNADIAIPLPDFVRTWERTVTPEPKLDAEPYAEALPPPGVDEVYEADLPPEPPRAPRSTLSREERINLQKQARALGMTLWQLTAAQAGDTIKPKRESQVLKAAHGEVMSELAGMFGTIRARKGMSTEPDV